MYKLIIELLKLQKNKDKATKSVQHICVIYVQLLQES